jgi:hypothetical protein
MINLFLFLPFPILRDETEEPGWLGPSGKKKKDNN